MTNTQRIAIDAIKTRLWALAGMTEGAQRAALKAEGWSDQAIDAAMRETDG